MKLLTKNNDMRAVDYFGMKVEIPRHATYLAVQGYAPELFAFDFIPEIRKVEQMWEQGLGYYIGTVDLEGVDWRDTLREV